MNRQGAKDAKNKKGQIALMMKSALGRARHAPLTIDLDHFGVGSMESIPVSKFKATCVAVLQRVKRTGRPVLITRFGQPVAEVIPPQKKVSSAGTIPTGHCAFR